MAKRFMQDSVGYAMQGFNTKDKWLYIKADAFWRDLVDQPACYVVFNETNAQPVYIGQSETPRKRFFQHFGEAQKNGYETPWGRLEYLYIKIKYPRRCGYELMLEKRLIRRLKPRFNKRKCKARPYAAWC